MPCAKLWSTQRCNKLNYSKDEASMKFALPAKIISVTSHWLVFIPAALMMQTWQVTAPVLQRLQAQKVKFQTTWKFKTKQLANMMCLVYHQTTPVYWCKSQLHAVPLYQGQFDSIAHLQGWDMDIFLEFKILSLFNVWMVPSHHLNQCWWKVSGILGKTFVKFQSKYKRFCQVKMSSAKWWPFCLCHNFKHAIHSAVNVF